MANTDAPIVLHDMPANKLDTKEGAGTIEIVKRKAGRPSKFTPEILEEICERLSDGEPLAVICRDEHMPSRDTVYDWEDRGVDPDITRRIAEARDRGFDAIAQEAMDIADETSRDTITTERGQPAQNGEWIARSRLRVETRLKLLAKWCPRRYGERLEVEHSGSVAQITPADVQAALLRRARGAVIEFKAESQQEAISQVSESAQVPEAQGS